MELFTELLNYTDNLAIVFLVVAVVVLWRKLAKEQEDHLLERQAHGKLLNERNDKLVEMLEKSIQSNTLVAERLRELA